MTMCYSHEYASHTKRGRDRLPACSCVDSNDNLLSIQDIPQQDPTLSPRSASAKGLKALLKLENKAEEAQHKRFLQYPAALGCLSTVRINPSVNE